MKRLIILFLVLAVAGGGVFYYYHHASGYVVPQWKLAKVDTGSIMVVITATGAVEPVTTVQVGAQVSGIVTKLFVDFDSVVRKNQVIAMLDTTLLYPVMLNAEAAVEKARANVELTRMQLERIDTLYKSKVESKNSFDVAYENYHAARADLLAAQATLDNDKTNLRYATIKSPCNGTVISRNVDVGQTVISSFNAPQLFTIATDLTLMQDLADVDEADIGQVKEGQDAAFTVDAYPYDVFRGKVVQIRLNPVNIQNVNNYVVVINVPNPEKKLLPGLTATTTIKTAEHDHIMKVLAAAIHFTPPADYLIHQHFPDSMAQAMQNYRIAGNVIPKPGTQVYVWVKQGDELKPVLVTTGLFDGTNIEIAGALAVGDQVVAGIGAAPVSSSTANNPFMPQLRPAANKK